MVEMWFGMWEEEGQGLRVVSQVVGHWWVGGKRCWKWWDVALEWRCPVGRWDPGPMHIPMRHLGGSCQVEDWELWWLPNSKIVEEWELVGSMVLYWPGAPEGAPLAQEHLLRELGWPGSGWSTCPVPRGVGRAIVHWAPSHSFRLQIGLVAT